MRGNYIFAIEGLESAEDLPYTDEQIVRAASRAINSSLDRARVLSVREMRRQVRFPQSYLRGDDSRLRVTQRASGHRLEGVVAGRRRPTSLARFVTGGGRNRKPVTVEVKPGRATTIKRGFLINLRRGSGGLGNQGLAIRTDGSKPDRAYRPKKIGDNLWLLYGPSVDQVFQTVRDDISPEVQDHLEGEFLRLLEVGV